MTRRLEGKVALITGAARGQGRSHAVRFAQEGADIVGFDLCDQIDSVPYGMSTPDDLAETVALVEAQDRRMVGVVGDVRDTEALDGAVATAVSEFGGLDIVVANAGIFTFASAGSVDPQAWKDVLDVNLTGVWNTVVAAIPALRQRGGGSVVITSSVLGLKGQANTAHYTAAKHGGVGLMRTLAIELAPDGIRVNTVNPTTVGTAMFHNEATYRLFRPDLESPTREDVAEVCRTENVMGVPWVDPEDITNAVLFLASEESRYVTGIALPVDAGITS